MRKWDGKKHLLNVLQAKTRSVKNIYARGVIKCLGRSKKSLNDNPEQKLITHILYLEIRHLSQTFNRPQVQNYDTNLEQTIQTYNIQPTMIFDI